MATEVIMPALGMAQDTGILVSWLRKEGEEITKGEPLMEVETDKALVEVEAPASGRLAAVTAAEGDQVPVGTVIARILAPGEAVPAPAEPQAPPADAAGEAPAPVDGATSDAGAGSGAPRRGASRLAAASPKARRLAAGRGLDVGALAGSGPGGAVVAADLLGIEPQAARIETGRLWRRMAENTAASWSTAPHFYLTREVHAGGLIAWRQELRAGGAAVTYSDLLVKLVAGALRDHPRVNARWRDGVALQPEVNVALAVATEEGLWAPVIHGADALTPARIAARRSELVERARAGRLAPEDLIGGTFTISNLGMYGVDAFTAILNSGQGAILAVGRIADRVLAVGGRPEVRPAMVLNLTCDHRVIDGARGAEFLAALAAAVERPPRNA